MPRCVPVFASDLLRVCHVCVPCVTCVSRVSRVCHVCVTCVTCVCVCVTCVCVLNNPSIVFDKSLRLSFKARSKFGIGRIVSLMQIDAQKICDSIPYLHLTWSSPLQLGVALYLLYQQAYPHPCVCVSHLCVCVSHPCVCVSHLCVCVCHTCVCVSHLCVCVYNTTQHNTSHTTPHHTTPHHTT